MNGTVDIDGVSFSRTEIEISVVCPMRNPDGSCAFAEGTTVKLRARWVCPADQTFDNKFICRETDFDLFTTLFGTVSFNPANVGASADLPTTPTTPTAGGIQSVPPPPCDGGYLIVWVVDTSDRPIKFDGLFGNAVIRHSTQAAGAYNAVPIQAVTALATGALIPTVPSGSLIFDGITAYKAVTGKIFGTVRFERPPSSPPNPPTGEIQTFLTLLTLDVSSNRPNYPTFVNLNFYNANELLLSTFTEFVCWTRVRLTTIAVSLNEASQGSQKGMFESTSAEKFPFIRIADTAGPVPILAIIETLEFSAPPVVGGPGTLVREYIINGLTLGPGIETPVLKAITCTAGGTCTCTTARECACVDTFGFCDTKTVTGPESGEFTDCNVGSVVDLCFPRRD